MILPYSVKGDYSTFARLVWLSLAIIGRVKMSNDVELNANGQLISARSAQRGFTLRLMSNINQIS